MMLCPADVMFPPQSGDPFSSVLPARMELPMIDGLTLLMPP